MDNLPVPIVGVGGLVLGVIIGFALSGPDLKDTERRLTAAIQGGAETAGSSVSALESQLAALEERMGGMDARFSGLEENLGGVSEVVTGVEAAFAQAMTSQAEAENAISAKLDDLAARVDTISESSGEQVRAAFADHMAAMRERHNNHHGAGQTAGAASSESETAAAEQAPSATEPQQAAAESAPVPEFEGHGAGQSAIFMDGALRVFVSGVSADTDTVRVAVNGLSTAEISIHQPLSVDVDGKTCSIAVEAIEGKKAALAADCAE